MHIYDKNFNYILETEDTDFYDNENYIISNELLANPIKEKNGKIREATREELVARGIEVTLEQGEIIQDKKLIKIEQPSNYHKWNGEEWTVDIEEVKRLKREELKIIRNTKINEDLGVDGEFFQVRAEDLQKFFLKKIEADISPELKGNKENWILANNQIKAINFYDIQNILQKYGERQRELFKKFGQLSMRLEACNTVEEIEAIKWE